MREDITSGVRVKRAVMGEADAGRQPRAWPRAAAFQCAGAQAAPLFVDFAKIIGELRDA
jgi:hypothetical protein